jgi:hypothetical protein
MTKLWETITEWPVIVQGALGSALFWVVLELLRRFIAEVQRGVKSQTRRVKVDALLREYIYKKYTSHDGLAYYPQGYFLTFSRVLMFFLVGMVFFAIALLAGGMTPLFGSIGLVGAIYFFSKALSWLIPDRGWHSQTTLQHWQRIGELEQLLFGEVRQDTKDFTAKWEGENRDNDTSNKASEATSGAAPGTVPSSPQG